MILIISISIMHLLHYSRSHSSLLLLRNTFKKGIVLSDEPISLVIV